MSFSPADLGPRAAVHLLNRAAFGPRPGEISRALDKGLERWLLEQLDPGPDPELDTRLRGLGTLGYPISQVLALYDADQRSIGVILDELMTAKLIRAVHTQNQLQEVLVDFWFNHFNIFVSEGFDRFSTSAYERDAIRPRVLGRFRDLLGATAYHPAMLFYLDNYLNNSNRAVGGRTILGINENYGRELLELHTVGVDAGYTQADVIDAARCFTGIGIDNLLVGGNMVFRAQNHDRGAKSVFGLNIAAGGLQDDADRLLDHLAQHPATARFVSLRLVQRFVADEPPQTLVAKCADTFLRTGGELREVMKTLFGSTEFWAEAFGPGKHKTPFEFTVSALRAVDAQVTAQRAVAAALANMGMPLYGCNPPTGYSSRGGDWINPSSHLYRMNFALDLAAGAVAGVAVDVRGVVRRAGRDPEDPSAVATTMSNEIFGRGLSAQTLGAIGRVSRSGPVSVAARAVGLCLAGPEMQVR